MPSSTSTPTLLSKASLSLWGFRLVKKAVSKRGSPEKFCDRTENQDLVWYRKTIGPIGEYYFTDSLKL